MPSSSLSSHFNDPLPDFKQAEYGSGPMHMVEGAVQIGIAVGMVIETGGMMGVAAGGTLLGMTTSGLVNLGTGFAECLAHVEGTPVDENAVETALKMTPTMIGPIAAATVGGVSVEKAANTAEVFEAVSSATELGERKPHGIFEDLAHLETVLSSMVNRALDALGTGEKANGTADKDDGADDGGSEGSSEEGEE